MKLKIHEALNDAVNELLTNENVDKSSNAKGYLTYVVFHNTFKDLVRLCPVEADEELDLISMYNLVSPYIETKVDVNTLRVLQEWENLPDWDTENLHVILPSIVWYAQRYYYKLRMDIWRLEQYGKNM